MNDDGTRRSKRTRVEPVAYWKNEKVIYNRRESGIGGPGVADVIRVGEHYDYKPTKSSSKSTSKSSKNTKQKEPASLLSLKQPVVPAESRVLNFATKEEEYQSTKY